MCTEGSLTSSLGHITPSSCFCACGHSRTMPQSPRVLSPKGWEDHLPLLFLYD